MMRPKKPTYPDQDIRGSTHELQHILHKNYIVRPSPRKAVMYFEYSVKTGSHKDNYSVMFFANGEKQVRKNGEEVYMGAIPKKKFNF